MSNRRKLRPPPTGYSFEKFKRLVFESDMSDEEKREILAQAMQADRKGNINGSHSQVRQLPYRIPAAEDDRHGD